MALFSLCAGVAVQSTCAAAILPDKQPLISASITPAHSGSTSCRECHQRFYELWAPSHHGTAMQPFTAELSRAKLTEQETPITIGRAEYHADLKERLVKERTPSGEKRYPIEHAMGGKNVFYFLTPLERGRLQVLPIGYDVQRKEWFDVAASAVRHFPNQPDAPIDWRESALTFNSSCFNCHVSQLSNNYDLQTDTYTTRWAEPGISCETCHGPGAEHIRIARATPAGQPLLDPKLIVTSTFNPEQMNSLCGSCHAKMSPLTSSFAPGEQFFDHFDLVALEHPDFYPDGRDLGENFTMTTWRMSPCVKSGKLDCTHCHTSSGRYRFEASNANNACLPCHDRQVQRVAEHTQHKSGTGGATCVSCHMPKTEFARMARSDHSMRPPSPAASIAHGSPNACNLCHTDKDNAWSDQWVRQWHKRDYQAPILEHAAMIAAARKRDWTTLPKMLDTLAKPGREEIWAASMIHLLRSCEDERKWPAVKAGLTDPSPLVRAAAAAAFSDRLRPEILPSLITASRDPSRLVRIRAAATLAPLPLDVVPEPDRAALAKATGELRASLLARPDDSASHYNLGNFHMEQREFPKAIQAFVTATKLQPHSLPPLVNISLAYNALGQNRDAEASLRKALQLEPTNAVANLNLGMLLSELGQLKEAEKAFRTAFASDPTSAAAAYNLGVLLASDRLEEAVVWCRRAASLRPQEPKYPYTLAYFLAQIGHTKEAIQTLQKSVETGSAHPESYALLGQLYERQQDLAGALAVYRLAAADERLPGPVRRQFAARVENWLPSSRRDSRP